VCLATRRRRAGQTRLSAAGTQPARGRRYHTYLRIWQGWLYLSVVVDVSLAFGRRCRQAGIEQSRGGRRSAYDNPVCESFFKTLKSDLIDHRCWPEKTELRTAIFDYIECLYNRQRRHSSLDYLSPAEYEKITMNEKAG
jgi:hypothetical protein